MIAIGYLLTNEAKDNNNDNNNTKGNDNEDWLPVGERCHNPAQPC